MNMRPPSGVFRPPYLAPMHGGLEKNPRSIDRDVSTVGRARGCDIVLDSQEVSTIHCVIYRQESGYRIRDCGSRTGVRINGSPVKNSPLRDGDIVVIGPFSFECSLPKDASTPAWLGTTGINHISVSRRRFAQFALKFRRRLQSPEGTASEQAKELEKKAASLKERIRHYDERVGQLEEAERELEQEREKMRRDREAYEAAVDRREREMTRRLQETEAEVNAKWQRYQEKVQGLPVKPAHDGISVTRLLEEYATGDPKSAHDSETSSRIHELERLLAQRDAEITRLTRMLSEQENTLLSLQQQMEKEREMASPQAPTPFMVEQEKALRAQCDEIRRMMDELRTMQREIRHQYAPQTAPSTDETENLRESLQSYEQQLARMTEQLQDRDARLAEKERWGSTWESQASDYNQELQTTRRQLEESEKALADARTFATELSKQVEAIQKQMDALEASEHSAAARVAEWQEKHHADENQLAEAQTLIATLREQLAKFQQEREAQPAPDPGLKAENDIIYQLLKERETEIARLENELKLHSNGPPELPQNGEIERLERELALKEALVADLRQQMHDGLVGKESRRNVSEDLEQARRENQELTRRVQDLEIDLRKVRQAPAATSVHPRMQELEQYENELNDYRRQLDEERTRLNHEIDQLRYRNEELEEASREMEMELSRERAKIAQERQRLDRLRDEIRIETDRVQREVTNREAFAGVQKLREELKMQVNPNKSVNERLKNLKNNLSDGSV